MELSIDTSQPFAMARLTGRLTGEDSSTLMARLGPVMPGRETRLAIGLQEVTSIDSGGLSCLIAIVTKARLGEGRVILVGPSKFVQAVL
ncbi:MAG: STAS domain-containing protein, partial [Planctomycetota bacterium]